MPRGKLAGRARMRRTIRCSFSPEIPLLLPSHLNTSRRKKKKKKGEPQTSISGRFPTLASQAAGARRACARIDNGTRLACRSRHASPGRENCGTRGSAKRTLAAQSARNSLSTAHCSSQIESRTRQRASLHNSWKRRTRLRGEIAALRCHGTNQPRGRNDPEGRRNGDDEEGRIQSLTMGVRTPHAARLALVVIHVNVEHRFTASPKCQTYNARAERHCKRCYSAK